MFYRNTAYLGSSAAYPSDIESFNATDSVKPGCFVVLTDNGVDLPGKSGRPILGVASKVQCGITQVTLKSQAIAVELEGEIEIGSFVCSNEIGKAVQSGIATNFICRGKGIAINESGQEVSCVYISSN